MILGLASAALFLLLVGSIGGMIPDDLGMALSSVGLLAFAAGWVALGWSALRVGRPALPPVQQAAS